MERVTRIVTFLAVSIGVTFFILGILLAGANLTESFIFALGMIVAFVPEGMLPTVTLSLAMGVQRMAKRNALIKKLSFVETLRSTTVICTDKTGTLTQNEMTVRELWVAGRSLSVTGVGYAPEGDFREDGRVSAYFFINWLNGWPGVPLAPEGTLLYAMATTMTFAGIVATQIGAVFGCRTDLTSVFRIGLFSNRLILVRIGVELALLAILTYVPFMQSVFNTAPLEPIHWAYVFAWTPVIFLLDELRKALLRWRLQVKKTG